MSATLTWYYSGVGAKTGTTIATAITDLVALFNSKLGDANFSWQVASSSTAGNPHYIVLKRKDGSVGRILLLIYTGAPAGINSAIFNDGVGPSTSAYYCSWFPLGNVDTPSNLLSASGTILGNDTDCTYVTRSGPIANLYNTAQQLYYFDSAEAVYLFSQQQPNSSSHFLWAAAGNIYVDFADTEYGGTLGFGAAGNTEGLSSSAATFPIPWQSNTTAFTASSNTSRGRIKYGGSANKLVFGPYAPSGAWAGHSTIGGSSDPMKDIPNNKVWFAPILLMGNSVKGEGIIAKLRQVAVGPSSSIGGEYYSESGPVVKARHSNSSTGIAAAGAWFVNFKV